MRQLAVGGGDGEDGALVRGGVGGAGALLREEVVGADGVKNPATLSLLPDNTLPSREAVAVPVLRMVALISAAFALGFCALYSMTAPLTCGVAINVPLYDPYVFSGSFDQMDDPGAPMSTVFGPKFENEERAPVEVIEATKMMFVLSYPDG